MALNPFKQTTPLIAPSILAADFANLASEIADVMTHGADLIHLDVMDGHFVPNISFGPPVIASVRKVTGAYLDAHLMISEPLRYAPAIVKAGAQNVTFQVETTPDPVHAAKELRKLGCNVGITLNPDTPADRLFAALDHVDMVLVMSVFPGFGGQEFMPEVLPKAAQIKRRLRPDQRLEIDGGIHTGTIRQARDAGVDWFVVGSAVFGKHDRAVAIADLRRELA